LKRKHSIYWLIVCTISFLVLSSCIPQRKLIYLQDQTSGKQDEYVNVRPEKTIQPFDNLFVQVSSIDEKTANIFGNSGRGSSQTDLNLIGYTVNQDGNIIFPFVGEIYVKGLKLQEAQKKLEEEVGEYLTNISITVKFINNTVAVLGEVSRPGEYSFYRDQITIFQALSLAGDFKDYGDRQNVLLIRESKGKINYYYLDLTNKKIVSSEYYYIIPNDVLIVKPIKAKYRNLNLVNLPIVLTSLSTIASLALIYYTIFNN
jgi:polysaccharide biosynthesis/export protein